MIDERIRRNILEIASRYPCKDTAILPALNLIQREKGYISKEDMREVSRILGFPEARIFSVASFYSRLRLTRVGKYHIQVCSNVSCHLSGSDVLFSHISNILGIDEGGVTPDGLFSLERVECLGSCGYGPAMQINCTHFENINPEDAERIINALRDNRELSPIISEHRAEVHPPPRRCIKKGLYTLFQQSCSWSWESMSLLNSSSNFSFLAFSPSKSLLGISTEQSLSFFIN